MLKGRLRVPGFKKIIRILRVLDFIAHTSSCQLQICGEMFHILAFIISIYVCLFHEEHEKRKQARAQRFCPHYPCTQEYQAERFMSACHVNLFATRWDDWKESIL